MPPIGKTLFYTIANNITGGGKLQKARAGVDYLKSIFILTILPLSTRSLMF